METEHTGKIVTRQDLLTAINPELMLIPDWQVCAVDEELEHHELLQAIKMYCLDRGWSLSFDYFPSAEPDEPYVVDCELVMPLPRLDESEERQASVASTKGNTSATTAALRLLATVATDFFDEGEEVTEK